MFLLKLYLLPAAFIFAVMWIISFIESETATKIEMITKYYFPTYSKPYLLIFFLVSIIIFMMNQFHNKKRYANFLLFQLIITFFIYTLNYANSMISRLSVVSNITLLMSFIFYIVDLKGTAAYFNMAIIISNLLIFAIGLNNNIYTSYLYLKGIYHLSRIW